MTEPPTDPCLSACTSLQPSQAVMAGSRFSEATESEVMVVSVGETGAQVCQTLLRPRCDGHTCVQPHTHISQPAHGLAKTHVHSLMAAVCSVHPHLCSPESPVHAFTHTGVWAQAHSLTRETNEEHLYK